MDFAKVLPLAIVMVAGPQIISSFFFATSSSWKKLSATYVLGAAVSISLVVGASYLVAKGATSSTEEGESGLRPADYVILALLLFAMVHNYLGRKESEPPKWMGKLQNATPKTSLVLGFLLLGFFPSDVVTAVSVGAFLAHNGDTFLQALPFIGLTLLLLGSPALGVAMMGKRAEAVLPKVRDWMNDNSWLVSEVVLAFFIVLILSG
ncbi:MAG TPA: GAP family protein [Solirubrobacterales bacterium]|nr:GAP family protein [Solirubrobacterales bacterium]